VAEFILGFFSNTETEFVEWSEFAKHFDSRNSTYFRRKWLNLF